MPPELPSRTNNDSPPSEPTTTSKDDPSTTTTTNTTTTATTLKRKRLTSRPCPYLDTINRSLLDFDFEHTCSTTLQKSNHIYGCLACGKFFLGRGRLTPAHTHSVDENHAVFVHLSLGTFHCLPDDYLVDDASLSDISAALHPLFTEEEIRALDAQRALARDLFGRRYLPGFVGLNNLKKTDYVNAAVQALAHVRPLRNFFLRLGLRKEYGGRELSDLVVCFGELVRKMWSDKRFKSNVDPHMMIQAVSVASKKRFHIGKQSEAGEFMAWLIHQLHVGVGGTRKPRSSVIHDIFQGRVEVTTRQRKRRDRDADNLDEDDRLGSDDEEGYNKIMEERERRKAEGDKLVLEETTQQTHFLQLTLDIPEKPLFKDDDGGLVIPQEPLVSVLRKFDGISFSDAIAKGGIPQKRRYRLKELPNYLILHLARFKKNNFYTEKNPTIVAFPVKNLDLSEYVFPDEPKAGTKPPPPTTEADVRAMSVKQLKKRLAKHHRSDIAKTAVSKSELVEACLEFTMSLPQVLQNKYDLVANITHDSPPEVGREGKRDPLEEGSYRCHVQHRAVKKWYEIQDLHVRETMPQLIGLSESYVLIFERQGLDSNV